jgi:hypothetical protein
MYCVIMNWLKDRTNSMLVISVGVTQIDDNNIDLEAEVAKESGVTVENSSNLKNYSGANMMLTYELLQ